ncbi:MAG: 16S rRNA (cytosine(1402)-N(4))-methyltransferase RsmH [Ginsengibacter sp.]
MASNYHVPVLLNEVIDGLRIKPSGIYVDCTFGGGGHSAEILKRLDTEGKLLAFDQDEDARQNIPDDARVIFTGANFRHISKFLRLYGIEKVDGLLADLGVSSHQFDTAERGFSTRFDATLDMRMDQRASARASHVLQNYTEEKLQNIFEKYGEVTNAKTLARCIVEARKTNALETINHFKNAIKEAVVGNPNKYLAKVFQALRIEVNDEMSALEELLQQLPAILKTGARAAIITFHSLEDRMVKNFFRDGNFTGQQTDDVFGTKTKNTMRLINKKPIEAGENETALNTRARSARLRVAERL